MKKEQLITISMLQPSQNYISREKVERTLDLLASAGADALKPILISEIDGSLVIVDGHVRAYVLWISDVKNINAVWIDANSAVRMQVKQCKTEGFNKVADLGKRMID